MRSATAEVTPLSARSDDLEPLRHASWRREARSATGGEEPDDQRVAGTRTDGRCRDEPRVSPQASAVAGEQALPVEAGVGEQSSCRGSRRGEAPAISGRLPGGRELVVDDVGQHRAASAARVRAHRAPARRRLDRPCRGQSNADARHENVVARNAFGPPDRQRPPAEASRGRDASQLGGDRGAVAGGRRGAAAVRNREAARDEREERDDCESSGSATGHGAQ